MPPLPLLAPLVLTGGQAPAARSFVVTGSLDLLVKSEAPWRPAKPPKQGRRVEDGFVDGHGGTLTIDTEEGPENAYREVYRTPEMRRLMPDVRGNGLVWMLSTASPKGSGKTAVMAQTYVRGVLVNAMATVQTPNKADPRVLAARRMILSLRPAAP